jgi:hypothetical protein
MNSFTFAALIAHVSLREREGVLSAIQSIDENSSTISVSSERIERGNYIEELGVYAVLP